MMKSHIVPRLALVATMYVGALGTIPGCHAGADQARPPISPRDLQVSISGESLLIDGVGLNLPAPVQEVIGILGKPDRESRLANTILTWDQLGIYVHVEPESQQVKQLAVVFGKEDMPFTSKSVFVGRLTINGAEVTPDLTAEQLKSVVDGSREFLIYAPRGEDQRLVLLSLSARRDAASADATRQAAPTPNPKVMAAADGDPLVQLAGDWALDWFVVGGGGGGFSGKKCGNVTATSPGDGAVSIYASCGDAGDYSFLLKRGSEPHTYLITVKSKPGISIDDVPVAYVDGQGWIGSRDQRVDGTTQSITARVAAIAGRNWYGWAIEVLPTSELSGNPEEMKIAYFKADLTRRK